MAGGCVIGVDLGGTKLLAGAVDRDLEVHHRAFRLARGDSTRDVLDTIVGEVQEVRAATEGEILAVGFGIPSLIDRERGIAVFTNHLPIQDVPFRDVMAERLGLPVVIDNDANVALLAEHRFGAARGARHALMLTLGTGIGGAAIVDGRLLHGATGAAGELGHVVVDENGPPCPGNCPSNGCLEAMASGNALGREALRVARATPGSALGRALAGGREITGALATELAHDGDRAARDVVALIGMRLGIGVASLVNVFNPEVVVIGGGVVAAGDMLLEPVRRVVLQRALSPSKDVVRIVPARFGAESGMLGAAVMAMDHVA